MIFPAGLIIGMILVVILRGKPVLWIGVAFLVWAALSFVPDLLNVKEFSDTAKTFVVYFSMYGIFFGFPIGIICLISGIVKILKEKNPNQRIHSIAGSTRSE